MENKTEITKTRTNATDFTNFHRFITTFGCFKSVKRICVNQCNQWQKKS